MRARAVWRARPDDPRTPLGWLASEAGAGAKLVAREAAWSMRLFGALVFVRGEFALGLMIALGFSFPLEPLVESILTLFKRRWHPATMRYAVPALPVNDLLTLPPPATPYPCVVEVRKRSTLLGQDAGIVTFVDGWLHFEGRRTSFSLRRPDVARQLGGRIRLSEGGEVEFEPQNDLVASGLLERNLAARFQADLNRWMRDDPPTGESILPPARTHASGLARACGNLGASLLFGGAFAEALFQSGLPLGALALALPFGVGALRAGLDLRRLGGAPKALPRRREKAALE